MKSNVIKLIKQKKKRNVDKALDILQTTASNDSLFLAFLAFLKNG